jgi:hypothetical protein
MDLTVLVAIDTWRAFNHTSSETVKRRKEAALKRQLKKLNQEQLAEFTKYTEEGTP